MKQDKNFFQMVCNLAIPVALQSMLQASFSIVDQIMIGQLGSVAVAGVGLAGKFSSVFSVLVSAIGAVAGDLCVTAINQWAVMICAVFMTTAFIIITMEEK